MRRPADGPARPSQPAPRLSALDQPVRPVSVSRAELEQLVTAAPWEDYLFTAKGERIPKEVTDEDL
ncbi:MAG: hypothetical protein K6T26_07095 [Alicyclobacillus sp.]|nr:hypothetical protein [Alicyclobacillus sp.]